MDDDESLMQLGQFIRERREARGWTVTRLAVESGLTKSEISGIEVGRIKLPGASKRRGLARALGVRHIDLLIAAGELAADEAPGIGEAPTMGSALAEKLDRLSVEERGALLVVIEHMLGDRKKLVGRGIMPSESEMAELLS